MKKISKVLFVIFVIMLFYLTKNSDMLPLTISFSIYLLFASIFSSINYTKLKNSPKEVFYYLFLSLIVIGIVLGGISYLLGTILNIDKMEIINTVMVTSLISRLLIQIISCYLFSIGYKKLSDKILNIYDILVLTFSIILFPLLYKVFKFSSTLCLIFTYLISFIILILLGVIIYFALFKKIPKEKKKNKVSLKSTISLLINDKKKLSLNFSKSLYLYFTIIILYYTLLNRYYYTYRDVSMIITATYFYGLIIIYYLYQIIRKYLNIDYSKVKEDFNSYFNKVLNFALRITILLFVIAEPINNIIFMRTYNILITLVPLLFIYIIYDFIININYTYSKLKGIEISNLIALFICLIFEIPLIEATYRMGYALVLGSVLAIILGLIFSIIVGIIMIKNKFKVNFLSNFNNILNIIYDNIIYALIVVILSLLVKNKTNNLVGSILVILFYLIVTIIYYWGSKKKISSSRKDNYL